MRKALSALAVAVALATASEAAAQVSFDVKAAYALPFGSVWTSSPWNPAVAQSAVWSGALPFEVGARYRVTPNVSLGAYFAYGPAFVTSTACGGASCSGSEMRTGLELVYGILPDGPVNPWLSLGTGWEWTSATLAGPNSVLGATGRVTFNGWEYVNVQAGADFLVEKALAIGPYVGLTGGTYATFTGPGGYGGQVDLASRSFHGWFQFGIKGTLNL
jgi:hypothetical protein